MRLAADDRGRVPFALLGVVLVLGSTTYAATMADRPVATGRPDETAALERAHAVVDDAVHRGTARAARAAARDPVVEPANTTAGRVLNDTGTFRDYLRLLIYLEVRQQLARSRVHVGAVRADPALPPTPNASALRAAKHRVRVERADGALRVRVEDVTVSVSRGGRVVERRSRTVERTVATPVLVVHDRVRTYEAQLDRGPSEGPGLGRRLTARLYAVAWTRGYAQYGGAPIQNVLANRHVELMTNGALLGTQRAVFGRSDPAGRRAMGRATAAVGLTDLVLPAGNRAEAWQERILETRPGVSPVVLPRGVPRPERRARASTETPAPNETLTVGVDVAADRAFLAVLDESGPNSVDGAVGSVYSAEVGFRYRVERVASDPEPAPASPGGNWTMVDEEVGESVAVEPAGAPTPPLADSEHRLRSYTRRVVVRSRAVRTWARGDPVNPNETRETTATWETTYGVGMVLDSRPAPSGFAPRRGIDVVHERGGPLHGPNLADVEDAAVELFVSERGGPDQLARRAVRGGVQEPSARIAGERPDGLRAWLYDDLATLRDRVRNVTVTVDRGQLGTGEVVPEAALAAALRERRAELIEVPGTYAAVAPKARVAASGAYVDAVVARLERRAAQHRTTRARVEDALADLGVDPGALERALAARTRVSRGAGEPLVEGRLVGRLDASVSGAPPYLTLSAVPGRRLPAVADGEAHHPLVARNINVFASPHGDVADAVTDHLFDDGDRTDLRSAARTLRSANRTLGERPDPDLRDRRDELQVEVADSITFVRGQLLATLDEETDLPGAEREAAVDGALARWDTTGSRGLAVANGSVAPAVAAAAERRRGSAVSTRDRDRLRLALRVALADALERPGARPRQPAVNRSRSAAERVTATLVEDAVEQGVSVAVEEAERRWDDSLVTVPAGLPLAPVPGYWYATTNVWRVDVRGEYARFAVSVPDATGVDTLTYVRDGDPVSLDVDDDGSPERLGRATRVSFDVSTTVVVVVPPGPPGVGDVDGDADERSDGWPRPGNATAAAR